MNLTLDDFYGPHGHRHPSSACAVPRRSEGTEPWRAEMAGPNQLSATKYLGRGHATRIAGCEWKMAMEPAVNGHGTYHIIRPRCFLGKGRLRPTFFGQKYGTGPPF